MNSIIKVRNSWLWLTTAEAKDESVIKDKLAKEFGYDGIGTYYVYPADETISIGDEIKPEVEPTNTVTIAVSAISEVLTSALEADTEWIPVAAVDQKTTMVQKTGTTTLTVSKSALESNVDSWKGGYINVNHESNTEIDGYTIEDAKFENDMLYFKADQAVTDLIRNIASSGRSIEIKPLKIEGTEVLEYTGLGLSVLFPPYKPACNTSMGCSSSHNTEGNIPTTQVKTMTEDIDKLVSAKLVAEKGRDEALKEIGVLKSSLEEKEGIITEHDAKLTSALSEKDATIAEKDTKIADQDVILKSYAEKEAVAAEKLKADQWDVLKSSIPAGKIHTPEDEAALKQEFLDDPAAFSVKMVSFKVEGARGESGDMYTQKNGDDVTGASAGIFTPGKGYGV